MPYSAVIFDLFGTLIDDFAASVGAMHEEMVEALVVPYERFISQWNQTADMRIAGGFDSVEANIEYVCRAMNVRPEPAEIKHAVEIRMKYLRHALQPKSDAINTLNQLKNQGYKIGLVSNCSIEIAILWPETPFSNLIDTPIFSSVARLTKPDERIYHLAIEGLGVMPQSCLYVGDGEDRELTAAAKVGLHPVLIRTSSLHQRKSHSHQDAREWQGATIANLTEVLQLVNR
jgi:putative hydrolase of the HAD superfamily